jgi:hypothetical protein
MQKELNTIESPNKVVLENEEYGFYYTISDPEKDHVFASIRFKHGEGVHESGVDELDLVEILIDRLKNESFANWSVAKLLLEEFCAVIND